MSNALKGFLSLIPAAPLQVGVVSSIANEIRTVTFWDGSTLNCRGTGNVGQQVFVRSGTIEGPAPQLPVVEISV